jgi:hypothetical protein
VDDKKMKEMEELELEEVNWEEAKKYFELAIEALNWSLILQCFQQTSMLWRDPKDEKIKIPNREDLEKELWEVFDEMKEDLINECQIGHWVVRIENAMDIGSEVEIFFAPTSSYVMDYEGAEKEMRKWIKNHGIREVLTEDLKVALRHCEESENYEWARKIQKEIKRREKVDSKK